MSQLVDTLLLHILAAKLPAPVLEHRVCADRRWRFDMAWPDRMLAVEVEGGSWIQGRHSTGKGMRNDAEKYNRAALEGWLLVRVTADMIRDGSALNVVEQAVRARSAENV